ncbi:hypothetical protein BN1708_002079 [Verticillium longisporum]|uniref:Cofilin n=2 Tax=Verticillium TaxID=1036719 RepID=A0A0G4KH05_VERLO|nr:hypothetical protein BN1708_002079 [Verticillium longisporum]
MLGLFFSHSPPPRPPAANNSSDQDIDDPTPTLSLCLRILTLLLNPGLFILIQPNQLCRTSAPTPARPPRSGDPRNMDRTRASVSQECIEAYNDLKLNKKYKYIVFKLSDDNKQIVIEEASENKDWESFRERLINATSKSKTGAVGKGPRYAVYDFQYSLATGEGERNKIAFIAWSPDDAGIMAKMIYASSKEALKRSLTGLATELQANDPDDIEYDSIIKTVSKGLAA